MEVRKKLIGDTGDTLITPYRVRHAGGPATAVPDVLQYKADSCTLFLYPHT